MPSKAGTDYLTTPAQLFHSERVLLHDLAREVTRTFPPPITIVNVGVRQGGSLHCLRAGAPSSTLYGIDIDFSTIPLVGDPSATLIEGDSGDPLVQFQIPSPIHLLFVDGGHEEHFVLGYIKGYCHKVPLHGIVAFHDYYDRHIPSSFGVRIALDKWMGGKGWSNTWEHYKSCRLTIVVRRIGK